MTPELWKRVAAAHDALADAEPRQREDLLAKVRREDPEVWAALQSLLPPPSGRKDVLDALEEQMDALCAAVAKDGPPEEPKADEVTPPVGGSVPRLPPRVSDYEILEVLGYGGMGVVYKARQVKLNREVALKMILAGTHARPADLARFRIEAEAVARLQHPNIVQIHEVGEHDGLPFFSLEYCPGGSLDKKLGGKPLPPREAADVVEKLARAVHAAHQKGVVHRDLKPANVLLAEDGSPKVTDFGLAKTQGEAGHTQSGAILGTPSYMAPEQAAGKTKEAGPAADVYALGAILYELLTGRPPFHGPTPLETLLQVVSAEPVPPARLQPKVPRDLETVCLKCLRKEPKQRYLSATGLSDDLRRFQNGEPVQARPVSSRERVWKWVKRRPALAGLLTALVVALAGGTVVSIRFAVAAGLQAEQAQQATKRLELLIWLGQRDRQAQAFQLLEDSLKRLDPAQRKAYETRSQELRQQWERIRKENHWEQFQIQKQWSDQQLRGELLGTGKMNDEGDTLWKRIMALNAEVNEPGKNAEYWRANVEIAERELKRAQAVGPRGISGRDFVLRELAQADARRRLAFFKKERARDQLKHLTNCAALHETVLAGDTETGSLSTTALGEERINVARARLRVELCKILIVQEDEVQRLLAPGRAGLEDEQHKARKRLDEARRAYEREMP
jgi:tRNA A-37 threonylcarbamoyl transferase component Bud32